MSRRLAYFRPTLDVLEDRSVPAVLGTVNLPLDVSNVHVVGTGTNQQLQGIVNLAGQAAGTLLADLTTQAVQGQTCPILNLHLDPIHLNLLGLHVDTSAICLDVSATDHQGLLGGLLCDLSGGGLNLGGILGEINGLVGQIDTFLGQVEGLLDNVLGQTFDVTGVLGGGQAGPHQAGHVCDILNLSLGPVNLDVPLLGVSVDLDNCANGPVTVDVTGQEGGGLLGDVLCGLADGLNGARNTGRLISRLDNLIDGLGDLAGGLARLDQLPSTRRLERFADRLTRQLERAADRVDNLADLARFLDRVDRVVDRIDNLIDRIG
jgi:hypothetical protein